MAANSDGGGVAISSQNPDPATAAALLRIAALEWQSPPRDSRAEAAAPAGLGRFTGLPASIALLPDGRHVRLLAPFTFTCADGSQWPVPADIELDGASIPKILWSLIGGPFEGRYRDASIVHDYYCAARTRGWRDTHRVFYEAMRSSGESAAKAKIMYYAVYRFGPRWDEPRAGVASASAAPLVAGLAASEGQAASLAADAEAIYTHDLDLQEIDALADARNAGGRRAAATSGNARSAAATGSVAASVAETDEDEALFLRARLLVVPGGRGTADDIDAVAVEAMLLPDAVMTHFERNRIRIVACINAVTDFEVSLRGVTPRGWPAGKTWDIVPGTYLHEKKRVVIATIESAGVRTVPTRESGLHGSTNLTVHESLHGFDYSGDHIILRQRNFLEARQTDFFRLDAYEQQDGQPGLEETFAESGARFVVEPDLMSGDWPALFDYWNNSPLSGFARTAAVAGVAAMPAVAGVAAMPQAEAPIGTAELRDDGAILLDLRAEGEGGAIGHASVTVRPDDPDFAELRAQIPEAGGSAGPATATTAATTAATATARTAARRRAVLLKPLR